MSGALSFLGWERLDNQLNGHNQKQDSRGPAYAGMAPNRLPIRQTSIVRPALWRNGLWERAIERHEDLKSKHRVGTYGATIGEKRLLELTDIIDSAGFIRAGTLVLLADGTLLTTGPQYSESALRITAGTGSAAIVTRIRLTLPGKDQPKVLYFDSDDELPSANGGTLFDEHTEEWR